MVPLICLKNRAKVLDDYRQDRAIDKVDIFNQPDKNEVIEIVDGLPQPHHAHYHQ